MEFLVLFAIRMGLLVVAVETLFACRAVAPFISATVGTPNQEAFTPSIAFGDGGRDFFHPT